MSKIIKSLPTRERGLKLFFMICITLGMIVAPHAGAWIETASDYMYHLNLYVAPHAGAWIETTI